MSRRHGSLTAFWNNESTGAGGTSEEIEIGRSVENFTIYVTVGGATTISVQIGHSGGDSSEGIGVDTTPTVWHDLYYVDAAISTVFSGAGSRAISVPDTGFGWVRLKSTNDVTATAGFEAEGD